MLSKELEFAINAAFTGARNKRHEFITVEHLLLALLDNEAADKIGQALADEGFAAGEADAGDAAGDEGGGDLVHFLEREDIGAGEELHAERHAIGAAEIAAIGDGEAHIGDAPPEAVDEGPCCHAPI